MSMAAIDYYTHSECSCLGIRCYCEEKDNKITRNQNNITY